jgi:uncharacterized lipoprotein YehR (DUF1307 family)
MTMLVSRKNVKKALAVCVATSLAVLVSACGDDDTSSDSTTADSITEMELTPVEDYEVVG